MLLYRPTDQSCINIRQHKKRPFLNISIHHDVKSYLALLVGSISFNLDSRLLCTWRQKHLLKSTTNQLCHVFLHRLLICNSVFDFKDLRVAIKFLGMCDFWLQNSCLLSFDAQFCAHPSSSTPYTRLQTIIKFSNVVVLLVLCSVSLLETL